MTTEVLVACLPIIIGMVGAFVQQWLKAKLGPKRLGAALDLARTVVRAADQVGGSNPEKLQVATDAMVDLARRVGLKLSPVEVNSFIHAALQEYREAEKFLEAAPVNAQFYEPQYVPQDSTVVPFPSGGGTDETV